MRFRVRVAHHCEATALPGPKRSSLIFRSWGSREQSKDPLVRLLRTRVLAEILVSDFSGNGYAIAHCVANKTTHMPHDICDCSFRVTPSATIGPTPILPLSTKTAGSHEHRALGVWSLRRVDWQESGF